jgi:hypothetical protein
MYYVSAAVDYISLASSIPPPVMENPHSDSGRMGES